MPARQWVLSLPIPLWLLLAAQPMLVTPVLQVVHRVLTRHLFAQAGDADSGEARTLRPLQAAARTYRIALGPRAGQKVLTVEGTMPREPAFEQGLCADINGFSLHSAVRCAADERKDAPEIARARSIAVGPARSSSSMVRGSEESLAGRSTTSCPSTLPMETWLRQEKVTNFMMNSS